MYICDHLSVMILRLGVLLLTACWYSVDDSESGGVVTYCLLVWYDVVFGDDSESGVFARSIMWCLVMILRVGALLLTACWYGVVFGDDSESECLLVSIVLCLVMVLRVSVCSSVLCCVW